MSIAKEKYIAFIKDNYVPIFYRDIFLDVVCDAPWDVVLYEENEHIKAAYIYMLKQKFFLSYIVQPQLCPYTGPIFFNCEEVEKVYAYLLEKLPKHQVIIQDYFHHIPKIAGSKYTKSNKHTYVIENNIDIKLLWGQQSSTHRRIIRKAQKELVLKEEHNMDEFLDFVAVTFKKRNKKVPNDPMIFKSLDNILAAKGRRKIVKCINDRKEVVAMCYFIKDEQWTYNFANSVVEDYRHYGMNLILWNEIEASLKDGRSFDFEGSMIPGIDSFFKRFKGSKTSYQSRVKSSNKLIELLVSLKIARNKI